MKKLTGKEILEILEKNYSAESVGYGSWRELQDESVVSLDEKRSKDAAEKKDNFYKEIVDQLPTEYSEKKKHPLWLQYADMPSEWDDLSNQVLEQLGLGRVVEVEQYGGEDCGSTWFSVKHFVDHDVYIRTDGYYQSYSGTDFYDGHGEVVRPTQKTVTVYE